MKSDKNIREIIANKLKNVPSQAALRVEILTDASREEEPDEEASESEKN